MLKRHLIGTLAAVAISAGPVAAHAQTFPRESMGVAQNQLMRATHNLTRILMGVSGAPSITLPTGAGTNSPATVSAAITAFGVSLTTYIENAIDPLVTAETTRAETAEKTALTSASIGTTVAPLTNGLIPLQDVPATPAATTNTPGVMSLATAGAQAPVQTVAGRTGAVILTHSDITDWATAIASAGVGSCAPRTVLTYVAMGGNLNSAPVLTANENIITSCPAGTGVRLPTGVTVGQQLWVENLSGASCLLYPASSTATIQSGTAGATVTLATTPQDQRLVNTSNTNWNE